MVVPINLGWPQIILIIVGLIGLIVFISAVRGVRRPHAEKYAEDEQSEGRPFYRRQRRRFSWRRGIGGIFLLLLATSLLWLTLLLQTYFGLTNDLKVAQVRAHIITDEAHLMSIELLLYDQNGRQTSDKVYNVNGDEWMLQADVLKFPAWLNILGVHSGYKLTRLEGRFDDPNLESSAGHIVITLNGGDDGFFSTMHQQKGWVAPFVDASYGSATFVPADGIYNVFLSQTGLYAKPA